MVQVFFDIETTVLAAILVQQTGFEERMASPNCNGEYAPQDPFGEISKPWAVEQTHCCPPIHSELQALKLYTLVRCLLPQFLPQ
eukprot:6003911-Karenia_brevis.AAC.1